MSTGGATLLTNNAGLLSLGPGAVRLAPAVRLAVGREVHLGVGPAAVGAVTDVHVVGVAHTLATGVAVAIGVGATWDACTSGSGRSETEGTAFIASTMPSYPYQVLIRGLCYMFLHCLYQNAHACVDACVYARMHPAAKSACVDKGSRDFRIHPDGSHVS